MTGNEYQRLAMRTCPFDLSNWEQSEKAVRHALFGLASEVGEIHDIYQKFYQGHPILASKIREEIGDVLWMIAELCHVHGCMLDDIMKENIEKLKKRYPDGFDSERSIHRPEYENMNHISDYFGLKY